MTAEDWQIVSASIQAISALVVAGATIALVWVTRQYVRLLSHAGKETRLANRARTYSLVLRIRNDLADLPTARGMEYRTGRLPTDEDLAELRLVATAVAPANGDHVAVTERSVGKLREVHPNVLVRPTDSFDWNPWNTEIQKAKTALREIMESI